MEYLQSAKKACGIGTSAISVNCGQGAQGLGRLGLPGAGSGLGAAPLCGERPGGWSDARPD
jgi:hypothetical protein